MPPSRPPTARLRRLASELLSIRTHASLSREYVTEQTSINQATLYRIETAKARPQLRTLNTLMDLYEVEPAKREALRTLLREASQQSWLQPHLAGLPERYNTFISFEEEARQFWTYEMTIVPGLLQTEDYARAVIKGMLPHATDEEIEQRVEARMRRQAVLLKDPPLKLWAIVDEAALRRQVGSAAVMKAQIEYLRTVADRPEVTLQVLSFDAGPHPAMLGAFVLLKFDEPIAPDIVYVEALAGDLILDDAPSIERYTSTFEHLRAAAASPAITMRLLATLA